MGKEGINNLEYKAHHHDKHPTAVAIRMEVRRYPDTGPLPKALIHKLLSAETSY